MAFHLSGAFNTVAAEQLLPKLQWLGVSGRALASFKSYLTGGIPSRSLNKRLHTPLRFHSGFASISNTTVPVPSRFFLHFHHVRPGSVPVLPPFPFRVGAILILPNYRENCTAQIGTTIGNKVPYKLGPRIGHNIPRKLRLKAGML
jgi:hypothetical protein